MSPWSRRRFLQTSAGAAAAGLLLPAQPSAVHAASTLAHPWQQAGRRPNLVLLFTDQERAFQHWPPGWAEQHLPSMRRLQQHGLTFRRAHTAACECTPSRATLLTGTYPSVTGVTQTFATSLVGAGVSLQTFQHNLGKLLTGAGYDVIYKGKWHESLAVRGADNWSAEDVTFLAERYGLPGWTPPDAGNSLTEPSTAGGGTANNDGRFVRGVTPGATGQVQGYGESVLDFLATRAPGGPPFCLFVALVNPHDIGFFPSTWQQAGYRYTDFMGLGIDLPSNFADPLDTKPKVQGWFRGGFDGYEPLANSQAQRDYVNFYAYLHTVVDRDITAMLDALDARGLTEDTLVFRFADHGEMGLSHGLRQKVFTGYEETIHIPLCISNPRLYPVPVETDAFASLVDLLPTLAGIAGVPPAELARYGAAGVDLAPVLADPATKVQDSILFSCDDGGSFEQMFGPMPAGTAQSLRCVREGNWMYAVYFSLDGKSIEYELYNLADDPEELRNLAFEPSRPGSELDTERQRLHRLLTERASAANALPAGFPWPATSRSATAVV
jgi:choline-sulfatase